MNIPNPPAQLNPLHVPPAAPASPSAPPVPPGAGPPQPNMAAISGSLNALAQQVGTILNLPQIARAIQYYAQVVGAVNTAIQAIIDLIQTATATINAITTLNNRLTALDTR